MRQWKNKENNNLIIRINSGIDSRIFTIIIAKGRVNANYDHS